MMTDGFQCECCWAITGAESDERELGKVVGGVRGETREGLHKDGTGRQLDFSSKYY